MLPQSSFALPLLALISSSAILHVTATPLHGELPDALKPRQSEAKPHPLDYAPDFSKDTFPPYPDVRNPDGSNITVENWRGTRLFGWKGCDKGAQSIIVETMEHFHKLANQEALGKTSTGTLRLPRKSGATPTTLRKRSVMMSSRRSNVSGPFSHTQIRGANALVS